MGNNIFFDRALGKASHILGKKSRLLILLGKFANKLKHVDWKSARAAEAKEKFFTLGRLMKAFALGQYRVIPWKTLLLVTAAVIYFISPVDLIPDWLLAVGFTDDFGILMSVYAAVREDLEKFIHWEKSRVLQ